MLLCNAFFQQNASHDIILISSKKVKEEKPFLGGAGEPLHACSAKYMARTVLLICSM